MLQASAARMRLPLVHLHAGISKLGLFPLARQARTVPHLL